MTFLFSGLFGIMKFLAEFFEDKKKIAEEKNNRSEKGQHNGFSRH
jgi:hypothetical protein